MTTDLLERETTVATAMMAEVHGTGAPLATGDVVEFDAEDGDAVTALVLLATPEAVIFDACDGSTPFVLRFDELGAYRVFDGASV